MSPEDAATMTTKGRITIPKEIRLRMGWQPGDRIIFALTKDGTLTAHRGISSNISARDELPRE